MSGNTKTKPTAASTDEAAGDSRKTSSTAIDLNRDESGVRSGDVTVSLDVASIITQVDRNAPAQQIPFPPNRTLQISRSKQKGNRRTFFGRLMCCAPKTLSRHDSNETIRPAPAVRPNPGYTGKQGSNSSMKSKMDEVPKFTMGNKPYVKKCLALDLDETLVHSSFQPVEKPSFVLSIVIEGVKHNVYVIKRPGVDQFIQRLAEYYELVIYTASLSKYADPLLDLLDPKKKISRRLFRENCVFYDGHYVKDLSLLGRDISQTIIIDNCPMSYIFHPDNAIGCTSFFDDPSDIEMWQIADFLESVKGCEDVRAYCNTWREWCKNHPSTIPRVHEV